MSKDAKYVDIAIDALNGLPDSADRDAILASVHQSLTIERDVRSAQMIEDARSVTINKTPQSWWSEWLGCLLPLILVPLLFLAMPLLFSLGERIISRPARVTTSGTIERFEYSDQTTSDKLVGKHCRITSRHAIIDLQNDETLVIPNEAYRTIRLKPDGD